MINSANTGESVFLSVVIANFNYGRFLEEAILSVLSQSCKDYELIVVDGGSSDESVDIIKKYADKIAWWVSEPDKGQSDAFNKGFSHAHGQFLTWLNADDIMLQGVVEALKQKHNECPMNDWYSAETLYVNGEKKIITCGLPLTNEFPLVKHIPSWARITAPSTFFRKQLLDVVGGFDVDLHYVMDTDLWIKFAKTGATVTYLDRFGWAFRLHEESKTSASVVSGQRDRRFKEERILIRRRAGITPLRNLIAYWGKRVACLLSGSYFRRRRLLKAIRGMRLEDFANDQY